MPRSRHLLSLALLLAVTPAAAQEASDVQLTLGAAVVLPGTVYVEPYDWDTGTGFGLSAALDYSIVPRLSAGLFVQYTSAGFSEIDVTGKTTGFGAALKVIVGDPKKTHFKVGATLLYQMNSLDGADVDDAHGLGVGAIAELLYPVSPKVCAVGQLGFTSQPSGGNSDATVTWGPLFFVGAGVAFGL
jgi:hypothetical protein